jgi:hypothetical protein
VTPSGSGVLPNFLVLGAEKAATTWLARGLGEHRSVFMPAEKELFFFSSRFERGLDWYATHFLGWSGEPRVGEATPVYLGHPAAPERIRTTLGEIELIVSLRHPVDRAYSAYWHNLRQGRLPADSEFSGCLQADAWELRSRGEYHSHLARYLRLFPRDRLLVLLYDRIRDDPAGELRRCLEFLAVDPAFSPSTLGTRLNEGGADITAATGPVRRIRSALRAGVLWARRRNLVPRSLERRLVTSADRVARRAAALGPRAKPYERLDPMLRAELMERYYQAEIQRLEELLDMDLSLWGAESARPHGKARVPKAALPGPTAST